MTHIAILSDDKAQAINGGFRNRTVFNQSTTATSSGLGSSATALQGVAVGNTGTAFVGIGAFSIF